MAINPNSGNFSNFGKIGNGRPIQSQTQAPSGPKDSPLVQQDPSESVQLGFQPAADAKTDSVSTGAPKADSAPAVSTTSSTGSIPSQVGDFLIAGVSGSGSAKKASFPGLNLVGFGSTSIEGLLTDKTLTSLTPLKPKSPTRMKTTSLSAVNSFASMGESGSFTYLGGKEVRV